MSHTRNLRKVMACPSLIIDDRKVILLSGFESEAGKLTAVTAD